MTCIHCVCPECDALDAEREHRFDVEVGLATAKGRRLRGIDPRPWLASEPNDARRSYLRQLAAEKAAA